MPDVQDRTNIRVIRRLSDADIDYSDIPRLDDPEWTKQGALPPSYHVLPARGGWTVRKVVDKKTRTSGPYRTQTEAVSTVRAVARHQKAVLVVYGLSGRIRSYQNFSA